MEKASRTAGYDPASSSSDVESNEISDNERDSFIWRERQTPNPTIRSKIASQWPTLALLIVILGLNVIYIFRIGGTEIKSIKPLEYFLKAPNGQTFPDTVTRVYWDYDDDFLNHNLTIAREFWAGLFPEGDGIVALTDPEIEKLGLVVSRPTFHDPSKRVYLVAAFHQLHCLSQLRSLIIKLHLDPKFTIADATYYHTMHCADVLRQQILCHADGTLIYKRVEDKWPGDGGLRVCNNFDALTHWTKDHHYVSVPEDQNFFPEIHMES